MAVRLWKFHWYCGRMGDLNGLFLADDAEIDAMVGKYAYFGEVLGKHSEIDGTLEQGDLTLSSSDPAVVDWFQREFGGSFGHNPREAIGYGDEIKEQAEDEE